MLEPLLLKNPDGKHANLCFVNAVIQILRHNLKFQQHVYFKRSTSETFTELFNILRFETNNVNYDEIRKSVIHLWIIILGR